MKRYIALVPMLLTAVIGASQTANDTINRMVLVESTYNPVIAGAVKRNFIPEEVKPTMSKEQAVYATENVDLTNFDRVAQPAQVAAVNPEKGTPGYAHLGYGNYNDISALAAYKFQFSGNNDLALKGYLDGWNGKYRLNDDTKWHSHLYDMGLEGDYNTALDNAALNAGFRAAHHSYNYLTSATSPHQVGNEVGAYVGIKGSVRDDYHYQGAVGYNHFGRSTHFAHKDAHSERHLSIDAALSRDLYDWGMAKVQVSSDVLTYQGIKGYSNYHSLTITPRWDYHLGDFLFVSGFNLDFLMGKNTSHPVQASPEFHISYAPEGIFTAKLTLDGGRDINTFGQLYALSPYWASEVQIGPTYTFMNAYLEGNVHLIEGMHLHLGGGYKVLSDALFETAMDSVGTVYTGITNHNAQVVTLDAAFGYNHKDLMNISVKGAYQHWMLKGNQALLARAPQLKVDVDARARIIPKLYAHTTLQLVSFTNTKVVARERAIIDWGLGAHYAMNKRFTFFLDAHNLLGRRYSYYMGYPAQGFNVLAGAMFKF